MKIKTVDTYIENPHQTSNYGSKLFINYLVNLYIANLLNLRS